LLNVPLTPNIHTHVTIIIGRTLVLFHDLIWKKNVDNLMLVSKIILEIALVSELQKPRNHWPSPSLCPFHLSKLTCDRSKSTQFESSLATQTKIQSPNVWRVQGLLSAK
jgi:hypothetical protein